MGDAISSLLFQPPPPTRLKESKVIWLTNSYGKRIPAFFIECPKDDRTGEGIRAPLPGENPQSVGGAAESHYSKGSKTTLSHTLAGGSRHTGNSTTPPYNNNNNGGGGAADEGPMRQVPSTPQIRTMKELEMSLVRGAPGMGGSGIAGSSCVPTILYSHANAEDLGNIYPWCKFLSKMLGVNIFAYDYTGYGLATDQGEFGFDLYGCLIEGGEREGCFSLRIEFILSNIAFFLIRFTFYPQGIPRKNTYV